MHARRVRTLAIVLAAATLTMVEHVWAVEQITRPDRDLARQILDATGIRGGLVVHLGCGSGQLTAALAADNGYLVHGLDADAKHVEAARAHIRSLGRYGPVSVERFDGRSLPYAENVVNLLVVEDPGQVPAEERLRVLVPRGVAYVKRGGTWEKTTKPWPAEIDEWTHWLHDASGNAVAHDTRVGPPRRMQWVADPLWSRGHEVISSVGAVVTARGRIVYALDEAQTAVYLLPSQWMLVARDAFNGVRLWKRPIPAWGPPVSLGGFTAGFRPRRLVTDGRRIYLPMGDDDRLTALDAATGATLKTLDASRGTAEILCDDGLVVAICSAQGDNKAQRKNAPPPAGLTLLAARAETLAMLWQAPAPGLVPQTPAMAGGRIFCQIADQVVAMDAKTGREAWRTPLGGQPAKAARRAVGPILVVHAGHVYLLSGARLVALAADSGKLRWETKNLPATKGELFAAADLLWLPQGSTIMGLDPATGEVRKTIDASEVFSEGHHPRCYREKATDRYVITNNRGAEFVSLASDNHVQNDWVRGNCGQGVMPANGLLYAPSNQCFCYPGVKLLGFNALAPGARPTDQKGEAEQGTRLERGPAWEEAPKHALTEAPRADDWPTYRHDGGRLGATASAVTADVKPLWQAALGGRLTPPVVCQGRLYVAAKDEHTLYALGIDDGRPLWRFTAGGRIDSPPSMCGERLLFGCTDGRVYCLRAADGVLVWQFQAAPCSERIVASDQLESPWPVHGSVLIQHGLAYFTAGRSSYLDGGIRLFALDPATGRVVHQACIDTWMRTREDARGQPFIPAYQMEGAKSDILVGDGEFIYLGQMKFDRRLARQEAPYVMPGPGEKTVAFDISKEPYTLSDPDLAKGYDYIKSFHRYLQTTHAELVERYVQAYGRWNLGDRRMGRHLMATSGFLDDSWFNRTFWTYSATWPGWYLAHRGAKCGQLLVVGPERTYAVQAFTTRNMQSPIFEPADKGYLLLADDTACDPVLDDDTRGATKGLGFTRQKPPVWFDWVPIRIRGMVLAGGTLFVAGPPDVIDPADPAAAFEGRKGALLRAYSAADGHKLSERQLDAPPLFDGLIAAAGRLLLCTTDGKVVCLAPAR